MPRKLVAQQGGLGTGKMVCSGNLWLSKVVQAQGKMGHYWLSKVTRKLVAQ